MVAATHGAHLTGVTDDRDGERRALDRVGTGAQLVEQHKVALTAAVHDGDDGLHVGGEGGQALLDALLVADVRVNMLEQANLGLLTRRDVQTARRHEREQAERLEG